MSKVHLSPQEMQMIADGEWILAKQRIIKKVFEFFGQIGEEYRKILHDADPFPPGVSGQSGKISKGENYLGLPYVILDYPATFSRDGILAVRTMFWWANFFSITLHISGNFKSEIHLDERAMTLLTEHGFFISTGKEWDHHFEEKNYSQVNKADASLTTVNERTHLKLAKKIGLAEWENADKFLLSSFREIVNFLQISYQGGKKDL